VHIGDTKKHWNATEEDKKVAVKKGATEETKRLLE